MNYDERRAQARQLKEERKKAYERVFGGSDPSVRIVLEDLSRFCREHATCFHEDPRVHAVLEGRREVMLRIRLHLDCSLDDLCRNLEENHDGG